MILDQMVGGIAQVHSAAVDFFLSNFDMSGLFTDT
jgi:hypothetical protein